MGWTTYNWIGSQIDADDMGYLYLIKTISRQPITKLIAEIIHQYVDDMRIKYPELDKRYAELPAKI